MQELATNWANVHSNQGFISITTASGYRACAVDLSGEHIVLSQSCSDEELGSALKEALFKSRVLSKEEIPKFFDLSKIEAHYEKWVSNLLVKFNGMSRRKAFTKMKQCNAVVRTNVITLRPNKKERGEAWSGKGFTESDSIKIPYNSSNSEIGEALRKVLQSCK